MMDDEYSGFADSSHDLFVQGVAAAKSKDYADARHYLEWYLRLDPPIERRVDALLWLVESCTDPADQRRYLEEALVISPADPRARRRLAILDGKLDPAQIVDPDRPAVIPVPQGPQAADAKRFTCPNCGGRMVFTPDGQGLVCEYCANKAHAAPAAAPAAASAGAPVAAGQDFTVAMATAQGHVVPVQQRVLSCQGCGAVFMLPPQQITHTCPYCQSAYVVEEKDPRQLVAPGGVIPFQIDETAAHAALQTWLQSLKLHAPAQVAPGRGLYLPAWSFTLGGEVDWHCMIKAGRNQWTGQEIWERRDDIELVDCPDLLIAASARLPAACRPELAGYDARGVVTYDESYLANWPAETYQRTVSDASLDAREHALQLAEEKIKARLISSQVRELTFSSLGIIIESYKLVLLPAWLTFYTVDGKRLDVIINGQTGHVTGAHPSNHLLSFL